ncbi:hypothetical protein AAG570_000155 [Ranatra chinensis]|uniref:tRNA(Phe) (4-demethylwyosine(37)-C(7)) aminocarboxypropyltransferase n=1 Tax=Ranatra chinensis TaxID=642074 RepID=A0ABD0YW96_9HEMI
MFSAGNATERHRVGSLDCRGEVVVDLFSGIGHFTLPYLVKAGAKFVHACDWNPDAIMALRRNLELNKVQDRCKIYEGDCRKVCPDGVANRVNLGLIPSSECGWEPACRALVPSTGGILYIHQNVISGFLHLFGAGNNEHDKYKYAITSLLRGYPPVEVTNCTGVNSASCVSDAETIVWKHLEWFQFGLHITHSIAGIMEKIRGGMWAARITQVHRVKSYAPRVDHLVYTLQCYQK